MTSILWNALFKACKREQLDWVGHSHLDLSRSAEKIDRVRQENAFAPDRLKLDATAEKIIDTVAEAVGKMKKLGPRLDRPDVITEFQAVLDRMAQRVTELVKNYREVARLLVEQDRADEQLELWRHRDIHPDPPEEELLEPDAADETNGGERQNSPNEDFPF